MDLFKNKLVLTTLIFSFSLIIFRAITIPASDRKTLYGDGYSDTNTYSAIMFFKDHGFTKSAFLPMHEYTQTRKVEDARVYTHYPALPDILSGFYAVILNTEKESLIRIGPIILSMLMCIIAWMCLKSLIPNKQALVLSFLSLILSNYFISFADNLHKHIYEELFKWSFIALMLIYYRSKNLTQNHKTILVLAMGVVTFLASNASFEPITYIAVVTVGFSWIFEKRIFTPLNFFLGFCTIFGFMAHVYQNSVYFGSFQMAYDDLVGSLKHRTMGKDNPKNYFTKLDFFLNLFSPFNRLERMFLIPGWAYLVISYFGFKKLKNNFPELLKISIVLLLASYSWIIFMPQHSFIHPFTVRQFGIFIVLTSGIFILSYKDYLTENLKDMKIWNKSFHILIITYSVLMFLTQQVLAVYLKFGFLNPWLK